MQPEPAAPRPRRLRLFAVVFAALLLAAGIGLITFLNPSDEDSRPPAALFDAGAVGDFPINQPAPFSEEGFFLVRRGEGEFLALYTLDPESGCTVPWRPEFEFRGWKGWFRDPCHGGTYDLDGRCFAGPCLRGLDRYPTLIREGRVLVDTSHLIPGPILGPEYQP